MHTEAGAGIKFPGLRFIVPLTHPLSYAGPVAGIWTGIGIVYLIFLYVKNPQPKTPAAIVP